MPEWRRKFSPQFKAEAVQLVIETGQPIEEVAPTWCPCRAPTGCDGRGHTRWINYASAALGADRAGHHARLQSHGGHGPHEHGAGPGATVGAGVSVDVGLIRPAWLDLAPTERCRVPIGISPDCLACST
jgi:hypothetical protein